MSSHPKTHIFSFNLSLKCPMIWKAGIWKKYYVFHLSDFTIQYWENYCELLALTRWPHIFLYFSLTECQKSWSHPMTPHFLSLCSHRMPQPVGGRALHPYPLHIWLPPPPGLRLIGSAMFGATFNLAARVGLPQFLEYWKIMVFRLIVKHQTIVSVTDISSKMASTLCHKWLTIFCQKS